MPSTSTEHSGLSKSIITHTHRCFGRTSKVQKAGKQAHRVKEANEKRLHQIRDLLKDDGLMIENMLSDHAMADIDSNLSEPARDLSAHYDENDEEYLEDLAHEMADTTGYAYMDPCTHRDCCSPLYPNVAISICTLAAYQQTHRACPRFTIQAQCKAMCHLHNFFAAFDVYLEILHHVDKLLQVAFKHDTPNWRMLHSCPACFYKLWDEPALNFEWLATMDGNSSLKRFKSTVYGKADYTDTRKPPTDYWIDESSVNLFQNEVKGNTTKQGSEGADNWVDAGIEQKQPESESFICIN
ncbi:hypothetical protein SERLA73DRAFT_148981 [Serpula lacrymans var. lacrymans S7.3]|uniref:Uncharacterized protein n=1 Tax=Serpula lacrymans var. lacrymans (strain S7.3) TaxID=936435 RepID=F8PHG6_SERL3|nr:hypothetical protein SERLA73DRAFT_148981 [Serpula lacrymans var. lacrymans S7.3]